MRLLLILLLAALQVSMTHYLVHNPEFYQLDAYTWETDEFRSMKLGEEVAEMKELDMDLLTAAMIDHSYDLTDGKHLDEEKLERLLIEKNRPSEYRKLRNAYAAVFDDLRYFPIPASSRKGTPDVVYADGWMDRRTYGGERGHEGCDIMGTERPRGFYPVVSISDGVVEKVGWLEKGGWRIGIRTDSGLYIYYAHLSEYACDWQEGDEVSAGQLLGFMGDTGYSAVPGTVGNFDVHLHLGLYLRTDHYEEMSVNPYWILRWLEKYRLKYDY